MLEKQRVTYLEHLGIDNYVPTFQLPHAAPSALLPDELLMEPTAFSTSDLPADTTSAATEAPVFDAPSLVSADAPAQTVTSRPSLLESLLDTPSTKPELPASQKHSDSPESEVSTEAVATSDSQEGSDNKPPIRFALNIWRIKNAVLVIDSRQPGSALPTEKLLQNILRSIHLPLAQLPPSELLRWPLFKEEEKNPHEEQEARAMVQAYIEAQLTNAPVKYVLLLGKEATQFALSIEQSAENFYAEHQGTSLAQPQWGATVLVAPSLVDMLLEPLQKRVTWQALQSVVANS